MSEARANVQWKGTDACMDVYCPCGRQSHFDGLFAYFVRCACGKVWQGADLAGADRRRRRRLAARRAPGERRSPEAGHHVSAVEDLHRLVEREGYTAADEEALRLLADAGWHPEKAAAIVLNAKRHGDDPVALARKFTQFSKIMRGE